jgi:ribosomal protein S18 acetylase RimI-like enzyme
MSQIKVKRRSRYIRGRKPVQPGITVHSMKLADIPEVYALGQRLFTADELPTLYRSWDEHELIQLFASDEETCLVADCEDRIVGFALGRIMDKPRSAWRYGWLLWLGVDPACQGNEVATRLMRQLTDLFLQREARIMLVDTDERNERALRFFRKHGFSQERRHIYLEQNLDDHPKRVDKDRD